MSEPGAERCDHAKDRVCRVCLPDYPWSPGFPAGISVDAVALGRVYRAIYERHVTPPDGEK